MLPFRPFQNECAGVSKRDELLAALDFDDLGERYRPAIATPFRHVSQYAVARAAGLLKKARAPGASVVGSVGPPATGLAQLGAFLPRARPLGIRESCKD